MNFFLCCCSTIAAAAVIMSNGEFGAAKAFVCAALIFFSGLMLFSGKEA